MRSGSGPHCYIILIRLTGCWSNDIRAVASPRAVCDVTSLRQTATLFVTPALELCLDGANEVPPLSRRCGFLLLWSDLLRYNCAPPMALSSGAASVASRRVGWCFVHKMMSNFFFDIWGDTWSTWSFISATLLFVFAHIAGHSRLCQDRFWESFACALCCCEQPLWRVPRKWWLSGRFPDQLRC